MSSDGKLYEELIYSKLESQSKSMDDEYNEIRHYKVKKDIELEGVKSKTKRQIDIAIYRDTKFGEELTIIECKHHTRKIDVPKVEAFIGVLDDVQANRGIMIAANGFSKPAIKYAKSSRGIALDIISLSELSEYLNHDYHYYNSSCPKCANSISIFGTPIYGHIEFNYFYHVLTSKEKYLKIYSGTCHNCGDVYFYSSKCNSSTLVYTLNEQMELSQDETIKKKTLKCCDKCKLEYKVNKYGNIKFLYKGDDTRIIHSGYSPF